jgi:hypothetical protein
MDLYLHKYMSRYNQCLYPGIMQPAAHTTIWVFIVLNFVLYTLLFLCCLSVG